MPFVDDRGVYRADPAACTEVSHIIHADAVRCACGALQRHRLPTCSVDHPFMLEAGTPTMLVAADGLYCPECYAQMVVIANA